MDPFVKKKVGYVTEQQCLRVLLWTQTGKEVVGRMMTILPETFGQGTDVDEIVGFENDEHGSEYPLGINVHIEQVELGMAPKQLASGIKLLVDIGHVVANLPVVVLLIHAVGGTHVEKLLIGIFERHTHLFHPTGSRRPLYPGGILTGQELIEFGWNIYLKNTTQQEGHALDITQQMFATYHTQGLTF